MWYRVVFSHSAGEMRFAIDVNTAGVHLNPESPTNDHQLQAILSVARNILVAELEADRYDEDHRDFQFVGFSRLDRCYRCGRLYEEARRHRCESN